MQIPEKSNFFTSHDDRRFLFDTIDWEALGDDVDLETYESILETIGQVTGERIAQNAPKADHGGTEPGAEWHHKDGVLLWPTAIHDSYNALGAAGLHGFFVPEEYDGLGLPTTLHAFYREMLAQADAGFFTIPGLRDGVADVLVEFASDELKEKYLPKLAGGWTGSMDLTEAEAGSDLGNVTTRAVPLEGKEGEVYITGVKRFITNGGADVHLVLARDDDGEDSYSSTLGETAGISMYLVPNDFDMGRQLQKGMSHHVRVIGLEKKLGIHSSPTCEVEFAETDEQPGAIGYLVGRKGRGMVQMFRLMNNARLGVAGQALGILEASIRDATGYATERKQFKQPISDFGLVKDMLKDMQLYAQMTRAVIFDAAFALDMQRNLEAQEKKEEAKVYANKAAVLTPLIKYVASEKAIELTRTGVQVHGGVGYTTDFNAERHLRDSVITAIYEGTSEIQVSLFMKDALNSVKSRLARGAVSRYIPRSILPAPITDFISNAAKMIDKSLLGSAKSRADPISLFDGMYSQLGEMEDKHLADDVRQAGQHFEAALYTIGAKMISAIKQYGKVEAFNRFSPAAKPLASLACETYGAFLLLKQAEQAEGEQAEYKRAVAAVFIKEKLLPNMQRYRHQINEVDEHGLGRYDAILRLE